MKKKTGLEKLDLDRLLGLVIELLTRHSPKELNFSTLSRLTGVPRSTLYYYFGNSASQLIEQASEHGIRTFLQLYSLDESADFSSWTAFQESRLKEAVDLVMRHPWAPDLYFRYRNHPGEIGIKVREAETTYCAKIAQIWTQFHDAPADDRAIRVAAYMKLGILWGIASERSLWEKQEDRDRWVSFLTERITATLQAPDQKN